MKCLFLFIPIFMTFFCFEGKGIAQSDELPTVFMIGENEMAYEKVVSDCSSLLLSVCQDSMNLAYQKWIGMLSAMEEYAESSDFDIKGIKIWINLFWNSDGTIKHIVYYPKPNSRNMDFQKLTLFFELFIRDYRLELRSDKCFSHYGSAAFPTFAHLYLNPRQD